MKSVGPDGIPHKILRELADYLAAPVAAITFCKNTRYGRDFVPYCISKKF